MNDHCLYQFPLLIPLTATISTSRFFKTNWLNSHRNQCSKLPRNYCETIIIRDSIGARLSQYQHVSAKFLQPLKFLNCGTGGDKFQHVLRNAHYLPVVKSFAKVSFMWCKQWIGIRLKLLQIYHISWKYFEIQIWFHQYFHLRYSPSL